MDMRTGSRYLAMFFLVATALSAVLADDGRTLYLCDMARNNGQWAYTLQDGTSVSAATVAADKGCELRTDALHSKWENLCATLGVALDLYSWTIAPTTAVTGWTGAFVDGGGSVTLGAGGLSMVPDINIHFGSKTHQARVRLSDSQTWRGPDSGWACLSIGSKFNWKGYYYDAVITADKDVVWTLDGRIKVPLLASNALDKVDVVVKPEARLILVEEWDSNVFNGRLGAKSLTLTGGDTGSDAALFTVGAENPECRMGTTYAPSEFDDTTVSPDVRLVDGASITGGDVDYAVSRLSVSGGDSTFSGSVKIGKDVRIHIEEGATFSFTGDVELDAGASVSVSGNGGLRYAGDIIDWPVTGDGVILCDPADGETVLNTDLSGFSGTIRVESGTLLVHPDAVLGSGVAVVTAEGASWRELSESDFGDITIDGLRYHRSRDGVRHPFLYMNDVAGNTTFGSVGFRRNPDAVESLAWENGAVCVIDGKLNGGLGNWADIEVEGLLVEDSAVKEGAGLNYFDAEGALTIGGRGIEFERPGMSLLFFKSQSRLRLGDDQVWRGPEAETRSENCSSVAIGGGWGYMYPTGSMTPLKDGLEWKIAGDLKVQMYYPSNDLSRTSVTVESPAALYMSYPGGAGGYAQPGNSHPWCGRLKAKSLTLDGPSAVLRIDYPVKFPYLTADSVAGKVSLDNGAVLCFDTDSSLVMRWSGVELSAGEGTGYVRGKYMLMDPLMRVSADAGATLDLTGAKLSGGPGTKSKLAVSGSGTVRLSFENLFAVSGGVEVDGAGIEITGSGCWPYPLAKAAGFTVDSDGAVSLSAEALAGYAGNEITVKSGLMILDSVASLPEGCKVVTEGDAGLVLLDSAGFDRDVHMGGTKNLADASAFIVTDEAREDETLELSDGDTLHVFGSGLKASSSVVLGAGSAVYFHRAATVSAQVTVTGAVDIETADADVEGVFTGKFTSSGSGSVTISAPGCVAFEGNGSEFGGANPAFILEKGDAVLRGGATFTLNGVQLRQGRMTMGDCKVYSYSKGWYVGTSSQYGDVLCELAAGATWYVGNNSIVYINSKNGFESRLRINGGTMWHTTYDTVRIADSGDGDSVFEFASGTMSSQRRILVGRRADAVNGSARFVWSGGTWKTGGGYPYRYDFLFGPKDSSYTYGGFEFSIEGDGCVFDLDGFLKPGCISNFYGLASSKMTGKPGTRLALKGHRTIDSRMVLLGFEPNGMALDLNGNPRVDVDVVGDGTAVHLGWTVPGTNGTVRCTGTPSPLAADYVVPENGVFANRFVGDRWNSGFSSVTVSNLVFGAGSTYMLEPTAEGLETLSIAGSLHLPPTMKYAVDRTLAPAPSAEGAVLVESLAGSVDESVWTAAGGISKHDSSVYASEGKLLFNYKPSATILFVR